MREIQNSRNNTEKDSQDDQQEGMAFIQSKTKNIAGLVFGRETVRLYDRHLCNKEWYVAQALKDSS